MPTHMPTDTKLQEAITKIIANTGERTYKRVPQAEQIERNKQIILMYAEGKTLSQIASVVGVTRARAHQIIQEAIKNHQKN